jgi:predicted Zn finger-like uncharacterized protein
MRITCPTCRAEYQVPDARLRPGLMMRCHRCGNEFAAPVPEFAPAPAAPDAAPGEDDGRDLPPLPPLTAAGRAIPSVPEKPKPNRALQAAWAGSIVLLVLLLTGAVVWHAALSQAWPPLARAYRLIGLS